jgi:hypothetical protein
LSVLELLPTRGGAPPHARAQLHQDLREHALARAQRVSTRVDSSDYTVYRLTVLVRGLTSASENTANLCVTDDGVLLAFHPADTLGVYSDSDYDSDRYGLIDDDVDDSLREVGVMTPAIDRSLMSERSAGHELAVTVYRGNLVRFLCHQSHYLLLLYGHGINSRDVFVEAPALGVRHLARMLHLRLPSDYPAFRNNISWALGDRSLCPHCMDVLTNTVENMSPNSDLPRHRITEALATVTEFQLRCHSTELVQFLGSSHGVQRYVLFQCQCNCILRLFINGRVATSTSADVHDRIAWRCEYVADGNWYKSYFLPPSGPNTLQPRGNVDVDSTIPHCAPFTYDATTSLIEPLPHFFRPLPPAPPIPPPLPPSASAGHGPASTAVVIPHGP